MEAIEPLALSEIGVYLLRMDAAEWTEGLYQALSGALPPHSFLVVIPPGDVLTAMSQASLRNLVNELQTLEVERMDRMFYELDT